MTFPKYLLQCSLSSCPFGAHVTRCTSACWPIQQRGMLFSVRGGACTPFSFHLFFFFPGRWCDFCAYRTNRQQGAVLQFVCSWWQEEEHAGICSQGHPRAGEPKVTETCMWESNFRFSLYNFQLKLSRLGTACLLRLTVCCFWLGFTAVTFIMS